MRTIVDIPAELLYRLDFVANRDRISRAEAVRRAIEVAYPAENARWTVMEVRKQAYGMYLEEQGNKEKNEKQTPEDSVDYVNKLRDEWER